MSGEDRKRSPDLASVEGDDFPLRSGLVDSSSSSSSLTKNAKRKASKRRKMDVAKIHTKDNQTDPMGYRRISGILDFTDEEFAEHLGNAKTSFLRQFDTKIKLGMEHLRCIGRALIRINRFAEPEREQWCSMIDARIEEFFKMQLIPRIFSREMDEECLITRHDNYRHYVDMTVRTIVPLIALRVRKNAQLAVCTQSVPSFVVIHANR